MRGRGGLAGKHRRAVDQQQRQRTRPGGLHRRLDGERPAAGAPREAPRQRARRLRRDGGARLRGKAPQPIPEVFRPARAEIGVEAGAGLGRQGREGVEARVRPVVAGQHREPHAVGPGDRGGALDAVAPVVEAAEAADDADPGAGDHRVDVEIDRHRVAQLRHLGEPQRGQARFGRVRAGDGRQIRIGEGQEHDLARRLAEIDGRLALVEGDRIEADQVHGAGALTAPGGRGPAAPACAGCARPAAGARRQKGRWAARAGSRG